MAHRAVGAGQSIALAGTAATSSAFKVQSSVVRVVAKGAPAFVAIGTNPVATTSDYYVPAGGTATLGITKASQRVVDIIVGAATTLVCPEGTQMPFVVGDRVTIQDSSDSNYDTKINNAKVTAVYASSGRDGYFQTRIRVAADTSGISTAFDPKCHASLYKSLSVSALTPDGATGGVLYAQQVQTSGDA